MRERVQAILDRELERLNQRSAEEGLDLDDVRKLDLLIKAYRTFADDGDKHDRPDSPASLPTHDLLSDLQAHSGGAR